MCSLCWAFYLDCVHSDLCMAVTFLLPCSCMLGSVNIDLCCGRGKRLSMSLIVQKWSKTAWKGVEAGVTELHGQWSVRLPCDTGVQEGGTWKWAVGSVVGGLLNILLHFQVAQMCIKSPSHLGSAVIYFTCAWSPLWAPLQCV